PPPQKATPATRPTPQTPPKKPAAPAKELGELPEWNLGDLYASIDDPKIKRDLDRADEYSKAFEDDFKGKLAALVAQPDGGLALAQAVVRYEQLDDLLGRLISFAGLVHAGDTDDPARAKFYGDVQERITAASTHLLFFVLELNRIDDAKLEAAMHEPKLAYYRPWLEALRKQKPDQLEDRVEPLPHEQSVTPFGARNRLFAEPIARFRFKVRRQSLAIEPTLSLMQDPDENQRRAAAEALAKTFKESLPQF